MALTDAERKVCESIAARQQQLVDTLAAWVAIPTGRGFRPGLHKQRAVLARTLRALGAVTRDHGCAPRPTWLEGTDSGHGAPSAGESGASSANGAQSSEQPHGGESAFGAEHAPVDVLVGEHAGAGPRILLSGHFDTVHDPHGAFQGLRALDNGRATGPGCVDMKGGLVVAFAALQALKDCGHAVRWSFVLSPDEETGSFGSAPVLEKLARTHQVGLVFEPAGEGGTLITERMGAGQFRLDAFGRSAHAGRDPEKGANAVAALCQAVVDVSALSAPAEGRVVNVGPLQGGVATNIVPDRAIAWGNVRFGSAEAERALAAALDSIGAAGAGGAGASGAGSAAAEARIPRVEMRRIFNRPAKPRTPAVDRFAELVRACSSDLGRDLKFASTGGVCEGNNLQAEGLPVLDTLGVRGGNLHRLDEWMELDSLVDRAQLAALVMLRLPDAGVAREEPK
jgi:glutamate carboxypeptidase